MDDPVSEAMNLPPFRLNAVLDRAHAQSRSGGAQVGAGLPSAAFAERGPEETPVSLSTYA